MKRVFTMCPSGHFYEGRSCPYDASQNPYADEIATALDRVQREHASLGIDSLMARGASAEALKWVLVVEFGSEQVAFEAIECVSVVVGGKLRTQLGLDQDE